MYTLGIDLGTTFTAAATWRDGHAEIASLGSRAAVIPSVVLLREDEAVLTGEAAHRRGLTEPHRVSREFKRRLGDTTPILLGGAPYSAEALMGQLLRAVVDDVSEREGGPPSTVCISHPANWGPYKKDLLTQAVRLSNLDMPVSYTTEPEAAAVFYAQQQRVEVGAMVAVYDLGGGTFDAAVLRKTATGFEILGQPEGIERLGGIDFDAAVFSHVSQALGGKLAELDEDDPAAVAAVARLREECVTAKEVLSSDTDVSIPVLLPNISSEIRLTRAELESMVRPALHSTIEALRRALRSAGVTPEQLHSVLLVGGSSRMPLVAQLVGAELGRPVAVDAHPKHAVALGAAWLASGASTPGAPVPPPAPPVTGAPAAPPGGGTPRPTYTGTATVPVIAAAAPAAGTGGATPAASAGPARTTGAAPRPPVPPDGTHHVRSRRRLLLVGGAVLAILLAGGAVAWAISGDDPGTDPVSQESDQPSGNPTPGSTGSPQVPPDEQCTDGIQSNQRWVCLTSASFDGDQLVIDYRAEWAGGVPDIDGGFHLHIYGGDGTTPPDHIMGSHAGDQQGDWVIKDQLPAVLSADQVAAVVGDQPKVCARIADSNHALVSDSGGGFGTGNCVPITR